MISFLNNGNAEYKKIFFDFDIKDINEEKLDLSKYKNKTILLVNVASNCGFTKQYSDLQKLYEKYNNKGFVVLGIPSNQFGGQEPGNNNEIKDFCKTNFSITFPMTSKFDVKVIMPTQYTHGLKKILAIQLFLNGIFTRY